jgi:DNA-binding transcriptional MerR regulator
MLTFDDAERTYRIGELARELDRSTLTIKKWEENGLIPKAKRDSRGWRYYTLDDVDEIKRIIEENDYFVKVSAG